jgi:alpha-amylase
MRKIFFPPAVFSYFFFISCQADKVVASGSAAGNATIEDGHPAWIMQGNIYEVNVRQYTPEGTFGAFENNLERLKEMGAQTLWFMPINPISVKDRKGKLGSYYAVSNYRGINPEYGNLNDWKHLVNKAHELGFKVIIDWVPNHTGGDHPWLITHPDFYVTDSITGKPVSPFDWTDVRKLNYKNPQLRDSMIASMKYWIDETGIDGFRCDVAAEVPKDFWVRAISELRKRKNIFMLAEANEGWLHEAGFDATYTWDAFNMMKQVVKGERPAFGIDSILHKVDSTYPANALRMYFTSNHDENSWNKADYGTMPGASHAPCAVLTQTISRSVPLIYSGQEEPFLDSVSFFYKDTISFSKYQRAEFYKTLLHLRMENPALAANASFKKLSTTRDSAIYVFEREKKGDKVLVVLNLSPARQDFRWIDKPSEKKWRNVFKDRKEEPGSQNVIDPWGYAVYEYKK